MTMPLHTAGSLAALAELGFFKTAQGKVEFAPGIPKSKPIARLPAITSKTLNRWVLAVQEHEAERAGKHYDLRLVDPDSGKAHSWAIPKAKLPSPGERLLAIQTFTHTPEYALHFGEKKPQTIGQGYGKGRVWMALKEPTDIIESSNDHVRFNVYQGKDINEYLLRRTHDNKWLLQNTTVTKETADVPQSKPKYKEIAPNKVDVTDASHLMMAKIDGAHNTFRLDAGGPVRVFSYRPTERDSGIIEHTHRFLPGLTARVPAHLDGLVLRGELFAADPHTGRAREAVETGAVLNSGVWKSRDTQQHSPLRAVVFDVARRKGQDVESVPYQEKLDILQKVHKALPFLELPPMASSTKEKVTLLNRIRTGQEPITREGVVLWPLQGGAPIKAKFKPDHDVYVREIFPEQGARGELAGGFTYSWTPQGKVVGRVGTGFNHELKRDMLANPGAYIGRVARVNAQAVYRDKTSPKKPGALRAPSFKDWHLDKGLQPLEKTSTHEQTKLGWGGTYYHGTSPTAEESIMREGLRAHRGAQGGASSVVERVLGENPITDKFKRETAGRVTMARSKTLAKIYGTLTHPDTLSDIRGMYTPPITQPRSLGDVVTNARAGLGHQRRLLQRFVGYQPLQVAGQALPNLTRDPSHRLLAVQTTQDVAPSLITKTQPSRLGRFLTRVLRKG